MSDPKPIWRNKSGNISLFPQRKAKPTSPIYRGDGAFRCPHCQQRYIFRVKAWEDTTKKNSYKINARIEDIELDQDQTEPIKKGEAKPTPDAFDEAPF